MDDDLFAEIYERYVHDIYRFAVRMTGDTAEAEDLTAETFVRAYRSWCQLVRPDRMRPWLFRIAHNLCVDRARQENRHLLISLSNGRATEEEPLLFSLASSASQPLDTAEQQEVVAFIQTALHRLPVQYRSVLVLGEFEGLSNREIARCLDRTAPAVKSLRQRARDALRLQVERMLQQRGMDIQDLIET